MARSISVDEVIDARPIGALQWKVVVLCFLLAIIDGFDASSIAYVAPLLARDFSLSPEAVGQLYSAALVGLMLGAFIGSPLADRWGRKPVIIASTAIMGVFSLLTAFSDSSSELFAFRFLTGLGLGGVMPNINTLTAEFAPARRRALLMTAMFTGFPGGTVVGGLVAAALVEQHGWPPVFVLGGVLPLVSVVFLLWLLPESPRFLALKGRRSEVVANLCNRLSPGLNAKVEDLFTVDQPDQAAGVGALFADARAPVTLLLWMIMFCNLLAVYGLLGWVPSVLEAAGFPLERAILGSVLMSFGGVVGGLFIAVSIDRVGAIKALVPILAAAAMFVALVGQSTGSLVLLFAVLFLAGFTAMGSQFGLNAMTTMSYGTAARATGLGWALAVGRVGAIIGPVVVGAAISMDLKVDQLFLLGATPLLLGTAGVLALAYVVRRSGDKLLN